MVLENIEIYAKRLKRQSLLILAGFACCLLALEGLQQYYNGITSDYDRLINISGRQRMLSQRLAYLKTIKSESEIFDKNLSLFKESQKDIRSNASLTISDFIDSELSEKFKEYILLLESESFEQSNLFEKSKEILPILNDVVTRFEAESDKFEKIEQAASLIVMIISIFLLIFLYFMILKPQRQDIVKHLSKYDVAKRNLEESLKVKATFLANMTHELRTPLNGIHGMAEFMQETKLDSEQRRYLDNLYKASKSLLEIVNDILDFSKFESGHIKITPRDVELDQVLGDIKSILYPRAIEKKLELDLELDGEVPPMVKIDPLRLKQILLNLLNNSVKFTKEGSVLLHVSKSDEGLCFVVSDSGIGISKDNLENIFQEFNQVENTYVKTQEGTGLGLALVKKLVDLMEGEINVESTLGVGTKFTIMLPFVEAEYKAQSISPEIVKDTLAFIPGKILIAEDNKINQAVISTLMKKMKIDFELAHNGREAVDLMKAQHFDLILMDISMPILNGFEATKEIRKFNSDIPIFCLSANVFSDDKDKAIAMGMNEFLEKPIKKSELIRSINKYYKPKAA